MDIFLSLWEIVQGLFAMLVCWFIYYNIKKYIKKRGYKTIKEYLFKKGE